jgi:hypothetical protein
MDIVHTNTTEHVELFRSFLNTYQLRDTADEEVPGSVSGFVAVVMMLAENDRPSNLVLLYYSMALRVATRSSMTLFLPSVVLLTLLCMSNLNKMKLS